jgi:hypothetical protein
MDGHPVAFELRDDRSVPVGPEDLRAGGREPIQRGLGGMAVWIAGPGRSDGDIRSHGLHERFGRRRPAAVVRDLQEVDVGQVVPEEGRVDVLLDVAHQQHASIGDGTEEHDRDVVDARPAVGRFRGDLAPDRPQHPEVDLVDVQTVAGGKTRPRDGHQLREAMRPGRVARSRAAHPGLEDAPDAVSIQEERQSRDMILVRVTEDHRIDPAIPGRDPTVEGREQPVRVGPAIDEQAAAMRALDEDRVTLADVEHADTRDRGRAHGDHSTGDQEGERESESARPHGASAAGRSGRGRSLGGSFDPRGARSRGPDGGPSATGRGSETDEPVPEPMTPGEGHDGKSGCGRCDRIEGRGQRDRGEWHARGGLDDRDEQPEHDPGRCREHRTKDRCTAGEHDRAARQCDETGAHRRSDERDDREVHDGR